MASKAETQHNPAALCIPALQQASGFCVCTGSTPPAVTPLILVGAQGCLGQGRHSGGAEKRSKSPFLLCWAPCVAWWGKGSRAAGHS